MWIPRLSWEISDSFEEYEKNDAPILIEGLVDGSQALEITEA